MSSRPCEYVHSLYTLRNLTNDRIILTKVISRRLYSHRETCPIQKPKHLRDLAARGLGLLGVETAGVGLFFAGPYLASSSLNSCSSLPYRFSPHKRIYSVGTQNLIHHVQLLGIVLLVKFNKPGTVRFIYALIFKLFRLTIL